jgi:hypothetical protein
MPGRDTGKWGREDLTGSAIDNSRNSHDDSPLRLGYLHTPDHTPQGRGLGGCQRLWGMTPGWGVRVRVWEGANRAWKSSKSMRDFGWITSRWKTSENRGAGPDRSWGVWGPRGESLGVAGACQNGESLVPLIILRESFMIFWRVPRQATSFAAPSNRPIGRPPNVHRHIIAAALSSTPPVRPQSPMGSAGMAAAIVRRCAANRPECDTRLSILDGCHLARSPQSHWRFLELHG